MTRKNVTWLAVWAVVSMTPWPIHAQNASPLSASARAQFMGINSFVVRSAAKIPEELYSFRPTPEVRAVFQLFGHIADAYFAMCSTASGTPPPRSSIENNMRTKADLVAALNEGAAYCASVMEAMNDSRGTEPVPFYFGPTPRLGVLYFVTTHTYEHYGNLVTYMRLNNIIPPSSETASPPSR